MKIPKTKLVIITFICVNFILYPKVDSSNRIRAQDLPEYNTDFLLNGFSDTCQNSCWYDLQMGHTPILEFLHFIGSQDFQTGIRILPQPLCPEPSFQWYTSQNYAVNRSVTPMYPIDTTNISITGCEIDEIIQISIATTQGPTISTISPLNVIKKVGIPNNIYLAYNLPSHYGILWIAYDELNIHFQYEISSVNQLGDFCLYPEFWLDGIPTGYMIITHQGSEIAAQFPANRVPYEYVSVSEISELTKDEVVDIILNEDEPCISVSKELYGGEIPTLP